MTYFYSAYGLNFASTLELPELRSIKDSEQPRLPDVEITEGRIEANLDGSVTSGLFFQASKTDCVLTTPEDSQYWLYRGQKITISRNKSSSDETLRYFLIYGALPMLLIQRGIFLLHGSAVSNGERALLLLGASRSGKSTLAAGLWQKGWKLISDEMVVCTLNAEREICLQPGIPQILLWQDAFERLNLDNGLAKPTRVPNQFILYTNQNFEDQPIPIQAVFCLTHLPDRSYQREVQNRAKFFQVLDNIYLPQFPKPQGDNAKQEQTTILSAVAALLKTIVWTSSQYRVCDLLDKILEHVE